MSEGSFRFKVDAMKRLNIGEFQKSGPTKIRFYLNIPPSPLYNLPLPRLGLPNLIAESSFRVKVEVMKSLNESEF